jgi:hypothetical protein
MYFVPPVWLTAGLPIIFATAPRADGKNPTSSTTFGHEMIDADQTRGEKRSFATTFLGRSRGNDDLCRP